MDIVIKHGGVLSCILLCWLLQVPPVWAQTRDVEVPTTGESAEQEEAVQEGAEPEEHDDEGSRITDRYTPLQLEGFPDRPKPILELGSPFLGTGRIRRGFTIPGGAVWTPSFLLFGTYRTGVSVIDGIDAPGDAGAGDEGRDVRVSQWANRLDLFGNLYLTSTERFVFGLRPVDELVAPGVRGFSGYTEVSPDPLNVTGSNQHFNMGWDTVSHLFFEGDLGELFPNLDVDDRKGLDIGFSVGRQPISFQEGLLINDFIDAVGITQNSFRPSGTANLRFTGLFAWNQVSRDRAVAAPLLRGTELSSAKLFGGFTEIDWRATTMAVDVIYARGGRLEDEFGVESSDGDGIYAGVSFVGRPGAGFFNTAVRVVTSVPVGEQTPESLGNPATRGTLALGEFSWTPRRTHNYFYTNGFYALDEYRAAALDATIPGPLARVGMLFAGPGLGNVPGAISPIARDAAAGAFGYQAFFAETRQQILVEVGGRYSTMSCVDAGAVCDPHVVAGGARYQIAMGRRALIVLDTFLARDALRGGAVADAEGDGSRMRIGGRTELVIKF